MIRFLMTSAAITGLAGCVSVLPKTEPPEAYYRIGPIEPLHELTASVRIREPEASRLFSGRTLAAEDATGALRVIRGVQWTDNATEMMLGGLLDALNSDGEHAALPSGASGATDYEVTWRMSEFTLYDGTARCRLDAALLTGRARSVISQTTVATTAIALDETNAARAKALTDAGRACISELAMFIVAETTRDSEAKTEAEAATGSETETE